MQVPGGPGYRGSGTGGEEYEEGRLMDQIERFLEQNPTLKHALEVVKISQEQYARALAALNTPVVHTATGSNEAGVAHGELERDRR